MDLINLLFLLTTIYLFSFSLYSKTEYFQCDSLVFKIKKSLVGFDRGYVREKNKWIIVENVKFLEKQYVLYTLKTSQKKCFNKNCRVDIKVNKGINNSKFFDYQSVVSNDFCQIDGPNKCFKKNKGKTYKEATAIT
tara:strand:+ start:66 stop:473 length:408 start_codon:yes stop_codon:yes gene_type:complete